MDNKTQKERLDKLLVEKGLIQSRKRARDLILENGVSVSGQIINKPDVQIDIKTQIEIHKQDIPWVSRGGLKLEKAIKLWNIKPKGWVCLDVGASTGGFTDVLLTYEAKKVYSLDVGHGQLAEKLKNDPRVINLEKINIRQLDKNLIKEPIHFISIDVSYISLTIILPIAVKFLEPGGKIVALIKPQFELGPKGTKKGIVKDSEKHNLAIRKIQELGKELSLKEKGLTESPILGFKGNKEFLIFFEKLK